MTQEGKTEFGGCIQVSITMCNNSLVQSIKNWYKFQYILWVKNLNSLTFELRGSSLFPYLKLCVLNKRIEPNEPNQNVREL